MSQAIETFIAEFGEEFREEVEERAAIMEYDGGVTKTMAEMNAVFRLRHKYNLVTQEEMFEAAEMSTLARVARRLR